MAIKIRLARGGSKKRPFYKIVATDSRMPRDGRFIEKLGTYNPLLQKDDEKRVIMKMERVKHWLELGAQPTDRIQRMLEADGTLPKKERNNPKKAIAGKAAQERLKAKAETPAETNSPAETNAPAETDTPAETDAKRLAPPDATMRTVEVEQFCS